MKPLAKSYRITLLAVFALLIAGCANMPSGHPQAKQAGAARRVVAAYQVGGLLAQAEPVVSGSLTRNLPAAVSVSDRDRLDAIVRSAYAQAALRGAVIDRLRQAAQASGHAKQLASAADSLETPLAQRMIALQNKITDSGFSDKFGAFVKQPAGSERGQRLKIVKKLAANLRITALQTEFNMTLLESMIRSRNAVVAPDQRVDDAHIKRIIANTRAAIHTKLHQQVPMMLLYVYRKVDTATLRHYAALQSRPDMVWTNRALEQAIVKTLAVASRSIPHKFENKD